MVNEKKVVILVPTIKEYIMPENTELYIPVQVGRDEVDYELGYLCDNTGDNISYKHRYYSELSATYWGWKNVDCDYIGLCHHRRYFASSRKHTTKYPQHEYLLDKEEIMGLLEKAPVVVPKRRRYYIETKESQYRHAHDGKNMDICREVILDLYPEMYATFNKVMKRTWTHNYNMFIMRKEYADKYCKWLFSILFEMEKRINLEEYTDPFQMRVFGYIGERLLDVWMEYEGIKYIEVPVVILEKINWGKKLFNFVKRKFKPELRRKSD